MLGMRITEGIVKISVRELVEFVLRQGSIVNSGVGGGGLNNNRALIGTLAHKKIQESMDSNYEAEVKMVYECAIEGITFIIEGRADGIIKDLVSVTIDEIKTTSAPLEMVDENFNHLHWAQAKCYAYFYAKEHDLNEIKVRLTYYNIDTKEVKRIERAFFFEELDIFFSQIIKKYHKWIKFYMDWTKKRNKSLETLQFPFERYRKGQREVAISVYKTIKNQDKIFINAPTGIGKTISTLFPALKAIGEGRGSKIFYLTAKTITRTVAEEGVLRLQQNGAKIKSITITAKDKICFCEKRQCHPDFCEWANGHYDRVDDAVYEMITHEDLLSRECIEAYARKYQVCPFEMALDLSLWVDVVICDYNYIFDPNVALKRFVDNSEFILLVDEAHNLVDRAREMYSGGLSKKQVLEVKKLLQKQDAPIKRELNKLNEYLLDIRRNYIEEMGVYIDKEPPKALYQLVRQFLNACDKKLAEPNHDLPNELLDFYFEAFNFTRCYEAFDEHYVCYAEQIGSEVYFKIFCIDPSRAIGDITKTCKSAIFFSATLMPIDYYKHMLGGQESIAINFDSPFLKEHAIRIMANNVSTRYKDREMSLEKICGYIKVMIGEKKGHYMVFFPSYKYMQDTVTYFETYEAEFLESHNYTLYVQDNGMLEEEREAFLRHFEDKEQATINFCVLGGIFSEGIDLTGDRLIGVAIVGVGIPQIGIERNLIKAYFDEIEKEGYHYAYTYPGMNKVLQAVGRLIRTEEDKGVIMLIDDRYQTPLYQSMLPHEYTCVYEENRAKESIQRFWRENER